MIFLDAASTTKPYQEVIDVMVDTMQNHWLNPSSSYADGPRRIIENVRQQIAEDINADPSEIVFTSGACEANSLAYMVKAYMSVISSHLEHKSIECLNKDRSAALVNNDKYGFVSLESLEREYIKKRGYRVFTSIQAANGEIGTIQDLKGISNIVHKYGGIFHTDATQLFPERTIDVKELGIDLMSVSGQKFHSNKGIGFLYVKDGIKLYPMILGSQENGIRGGTYNTAGIAGMGKALEITRKNNATNRVVELRNRLLDRLLQMDRVHLNGASVGEKRLNNNISLTIDGVNAEQLVTMCALYNVYIAKGSACNSYNPEPSKTLKAIRLSNDQAFSTVRLTLDEFITEQEIDTAADIITALVRRIREDEE